MLTRETITTTMKNLHWPYGVGSLKALAKTFLAPVTCHVGWEGGGGWEELVTCIAARGERREKIRWWVSFLFFFKLIFTKIKSIKLTYHHSLSFTTLMLALLLAYVAWKKKILCGNMFNMLPFLLVLLSV